MNNIKYSRLSLGILAISVMALGPSLQLKGQEDLVSRSNEAIRISSPDTTLVKIFNWAQKTSNGYVGNDKDPVGPWYEAALPNREAFCIRDVSHQSIGAEILWQGKQNLNMFRKFVENISESKDWCSYWEINRYNKPAPVDYASDNDFWYNLNANFDIIDACWKLYQWTGNPAYIKDPAFDRFFRITLNEYVERWQLGPDKIMDRPAFMNRKPDTKKYFYARGIPSYDEQQEDISVSGDLIGMIYNAYRTYASILEQTGRQEMAVAYRDKADQYRKLIDSLWWDKENKTYYGFYKQKDRKFYPGGISNSEFLLWYHVIEQPSRIDSSLQELKNSQVEVLSYLPMLFYRYGYNQDAYEFLKKIYADKRRDYPEASSGAIEGIVRGMLGVEPSASQGIITTCPRLSPSTPAVTVENIPVFSGLISVSHRSGTSTLFANKSAKPVTWRAMFKGSFGKIRVNGKPMDAIRMKDAVGMPHSYVDIPVAGGSQVIAGADEASVVKNPKWPELEEVILVWKTHNDIGYTHPVPEVLNYYRTGMMDGALKLIEDTVGVPKEERFVWVLPAWVMEVILDDKQTPERRARIERAIRSGRIVWHALPYTFESEAADLEELVRGLGSGTRLAKQFGQPLPADAKLTDMPSQAWALPTVLTNAGIRFVHIGVNPWSPNPDVPKLFWWEGPDGSRLLTGYSFHSYSWEPVPPDGWNHKTWLCFQVTGDNSGPPSPEAVQAVLTKIRRELPGVRIRFGRPSDFADAIMAENDPTIPVIRGDMPDTWTHGQMTMPLPTQIHRRVAPDLITLGVLGTTVGAAISNNLSEAYEQSCLFTEHTWGIAGPMFGSPDHETWKRELAKGTYDSLVGTFTWHADYARKAREIADQGLNSLMKNLASGISGKKERVVVFNSLPWSRNGIVEVKAADGRVMAVGARDIPAGGYKTLPIPKPSKSVSVKLTNNTLETPHFIVRFDPVKGGIASLISKSDKRELVDPGEFALGQYMHEQFSKKEVDAFLKAYCQVYYDWYGFPYYDFNKPRLDSTLPYRRISPGSWDLKVTREALGYRAIMTASQTEGLAGGLALEFFFPDAMPTLDITWRVTDKTPELIPEGGWICLPLAVREPAFRVSHAGAPFSPEKELVPGTNAHLFSIDHGITVRQGPTGAGVGIASSDLPLWSIGEPGLWKYSPRYEPRRPILFANLYNNQWNTNYPLWIDGTWSATLRIWPVKEGENEEKSLFTPSWELRQPLVASLTSGSGGSMPESRPGLTLSRKGVRVTAFCPNPDADKGVQGTLIRLWEQSGESGEVTVTLPEGLKASWAQPVNLRGEKKGAAIILKNNTFSTAIGRYEPLSFILHE
jgi:hypothetical protein